MHSCNKSSSFFGNWFFVVTSNGGKWSRKFAEKAKGPQAIHIRMHMRYLLLTYNWGDRQKGDIFFSYA